MTPTLAALLAKVEDLDREAHWPCDCEEGFTCERCDALKELSKLSYTLLPATAKALKVAIESDLRHTPSKESERRCGSCDRIWPCPEAAIVAEIEALLTEAIQDRR